MFLSAEKPYSFKLRGRAKWVRLIMKSRHDIFKKYENGILLFYKWKMCADFMFAFFKTQNIFKLYYKCFLYVHFIVNFSIDFEWFHKYQNKERNNIIS